MWRSIFLHEFPDGNVRGFNAVPGTAAAGSLEINPRAMAPGQQFLYQLAEPMDGVIGFSGRVRIRAGFTWSTEPGRILSVGNDVEFLVQDVGEVLQDPELSSKARGLLRIGQGIPVDIGTLVFPYRNYVDVRVDWHTSGQARLIQDGKLVGYHNALAPGAQITLPDIAVGRSDVPVGTVGPRIGVERIFVRALRRPDALGILSRLLPEARPTEDPQLERCRYLAIQDLLGIAGTLRTFMVKFHQQESTPWSLDANPESAPFTQASAAAHQQAIKAGTALVRMLRTRDFSSPTTFLKPFEGFLRTLHGSLPLEFESMAQTVLSKYGADDYCREQLQRDSEENGAEFEPIIKLIKAASDIVLDVAGAQ